MTQLSRTAQLVWLAWVVAGLLALGLSLVGLPGTRFDLSAAIVLTIAGVAADFFTILLPSAREHNRQETSVASALFVAAILLLPVHVAVLTAGLSYGIGWALHPRHRPWFKNLFNLCQYALAVGLAGLVWHTPATAGESLLDPRHLVWLGPAVFAYFVVNTGSVSLMVARAQGLPFAHVWTLGNRHTLPAYFGTIFVGILFATLWTVAPWSVLLVIVPLVAIHFAFKSTIELEEQTLAALFQLAEIIDERDNYTHKHSVRVGEYAEQIAIEMGLHGDQAYLIHLAGRLHDIGKCAVSNEVLLKRGPLTDEERTQMSAHPVAGARMLQNFSMFQEVARSVRGHHERWDGEGYPDRLGGEHIPIGSRVIAVADSYDAMTTTRPYRLALPHEEAVRRLNAGTGTQWDPRVVEAFLRLAERQPLLVHAAARRATAEPALPSAT